MPINNHVTVYQTQADPHRVDCLLCTQALSPAKDGWLGAARGGPGRAVRPDPSEGQLCLVLSCRRQIDPPVRPSIKLLHAVVLCTAFPLIRSTVRHPGAASPPNETDKQSQPASRPIVTTAMGGMGNRQAQRSSFAGCVDMATAGGALALGKPSVFLASRIHAAVPALHQPVCEAHTR